MDLDARILATLAYADLFGAGLNSAGIRQRLFGAGEIHSDDLTLRLNDLLADAAVVRDTSGLCRLPGGPPRGEPGEVQADVDQQINRTRRWATRAGRLPYVRFIGLTGSLAKGSPGTDADLFVVAAAGRAYLAFAFLKTFGAVLARRRGIRICVNFIVDERHLLMPLHDAFTATEFVTMLPLYDSQDSGRRLWNANLDWIHKLCGGSTPWPGLDQRRGLVSRIAEAVLPAGLDNVIRLMKRRRFIRLKGTSALAWPDVAFEPGFFKQHDASHRREILGRFRAALKSLGLADAWVEPAA